MKYFVVVLIITVIYSVSAITDEQKQNVEKVGKECATENGLTAEEVQKIRSDPKASVSDPKAQKFAKCFLQKIGFMDSEGNLQESVAVAKLPQGENRSKIEEVVKQCRSVIEQNKDENPIKLFACYAEKKAV